MSLTDSLRYALKGSAVSSRSYKHKVTPTNGSSFAQGGLMRLDIPSGMRNTYLDPSQTWLELTFTPTYANAKMAKLDGSANTIIKKIEVYSSAGSNLLESIDNYPVLFQACANVVGDLDDLLNSGSVTMGFMPPVSSIDTVSAVAGVLGNFTWMGRSQRFRDLGGMTVTTATAYTFQLPLICLIGTLGEKYIPLHALAADLRVEITLNTNSVLRPVDIYDSPMCNSTIITNEFGLFPNINNGAASQTTLGEILLANKSAPLAFTGTPTFAVTNVYLHCGMVQISDDAQAAVDALTGGIYTFHGSSWRNFQSTLTTGATQISFLIPARYSSLKQLLVTHTGTTAKAGGIAAFGRGWTSFVTAGMNTYQFRVGSVLMPQAKVNPLAATGDARMTEALMEMLRSFHAVGFSISGSPINTGSWTLQIPELDAVAAATATNMQGTFVVGLEMESFANKSDVIMSGVSTLGQNVFFEASYSGVTFASGWTVDAFACYDVLYT